jgi:hypothetical protein
MMGCMYVVAWQQKSSIYPNSEIFARIIDFSNLETPTLRVSTISEGISSWYPTVMGLNNSEFIITWVVNVNNNTEMLGVIYNSEAQIVTNITNLYVYSLPQNVEPDQRLYSVAVCPNENMVIETSAIGWVASIPNNFGRLSFSSHVQESLFLALCNSTNFSYEIWPVYQLEYDGSY